VRGWGEEEEELGICTPCGGFWGKRKKKPNINTKN
jgi:hypothetical protein